MQPTNPNLPRLPQRSVTSHKGDFGHAMLIGGSRGMSGAIALAGMSALRSGAGRVTLAVPEACLDVVASFEASYMTLPLPTDSTGRIAASAHKTIDRETTKATALACGPGLGQSDALTELVASIYKRCPQPMVFDADALNALAKQDGSLQNGGGPRILTPHLGEFRRLMGKADLSMEEAREQAKTIAAKYGIVIVLKGDRTLVTDGTREYRNTTGNPGMATGGAGDVLTGVITGLLCQGLSAFEAAQLGVYVHGLAGDLAAEEIGEISLIASDLEIYLSDAFQMLDETDEDDNS